MSQRFRALPLALTLLTCSSVLRSEATLPASLDLQAVRAIPVQHDGRWPPLDTLACDLVETVTGDAHYRGRDPVRWLLARLDSTIRTCRRDMEIRFKEK